MSLQESLNSNRPIARIARLPSDLIDQIAAGEVVERPSSLIKELVENSLDAGATRIEVHLVEGGLKEITVIDNGCGILEADLNLAVERHTTSKLHSLQDLEAIATFGFRGEALSSISAVSDFSIRSRPLASKRGMLLQIPFGEKQELKPIGCPPGTQISVKELFAKIPARFKFLRSHATELSHCAKNFKELAMGSPGVSFFFHHNGRLLAKYTATSRLARLHETLKPSWEPLHLQDAVDDMRFEALLSPLDFSQERGEITLFVNQRPVKNRLLLSSIRNSFLEVAGPHHEPSGVFYLDIRGDWVDVNVHPQKLEVRFFKQERIYGWLLASLRKQLSNSKLLAPNSLAPNSPAPAKFGSNSEFYKSQSPLPSQTNFLHSEALRSETIRTELPSMEARPKASPALTTLPFRFYGIVQSQYFLLENSAGIFILNARAFEEKIIFAQLEKKMSQQGISTRSLSVPQILTLPHPLFETAKRLQGTLIRLGFEFEFFGDKDIALKAIPHKLSETALELSFIQLLTSLSGPSHSLDLDDNLTHELWALTDLLARPIARVWEPCEITELLSLMTDFNESWTCPRGNPVLFKISWNQLQEHFKKI